jgi:glycine cleavage system regulatory protein
LKVSLVLTLIGEDRPGLVELLSRTVAEHDGSWLESRMSRMAGRFAGILRASVPSAQAEELTGALEALESEGLRVLVERSDEGEPSSAYRRIHLELVGADRPGIIREISSALARRHVNVDELETECTSAPMSGEALFNARAKLRVPVDLSVSDLHKALEEIAIDLMVDVVLGEIPDTEAK